MPPASIPGMGHRVSKSFGGYGMAANENVKNRMNDRAVPENARQHSENDEIDLLELFYRLLENWKWIIVAALVGALAFGAYTTLCIKPSYQATAKLYVLYSKDSAINLSDLQVGSTLAKDYLEVFKTWEVHEMVIENLDLNYSYSQMQGMLSVSNPGDTRVLYITVTTGDPKLAKDIANEYARVAKKYIADTMATDEPNIMSAALQPGGPVAPSRTKNVIMGFMLGAVLAAGVVIVRALMDDKIKTAEDIRKYADLPTLAIVPLQEDHSAKGMSSPKARRRE